MSETVDITVRALEILGGRGYTIGLLFCEECETLHAEAETLEPIDSRDRSFCSSECWIIYYHKKLNNNKEVVQCKIDWML